ncbi:hypothetical protein J1614_004173 [Plenodomus biglobosus]|nr:hypothetical protein J1614_004173 [Plenodomus biglobosus]
MNCNAMTMHLENHVKKSTKNIQGQVCFHVQLLGGGSEKLRGRSAIRLSKRVKSDAFSRRATKFRHHSLDSQRHNTRYNSPPSPDITARRVKKTMAKPKRMSEIFTSSSSSSKLANTAATTTATPPYSSEGPTLPVIGAPENQVPVAKKAPGTAQPSKKRKTHDQPSNTQSPVQRGPPPRPPHTLHPALYTPWTLLPPEILNIIETQARLRTAQPNGNIVPVVFSKNQNIKAGINKLKTLLGAYRNPKAGIEVPKALKDEDGDGFVAVSAQGDGTGKLVGIVEMVRRVVAPGKGEEGAKGSVDTWWMYTVLSSIEVEWKPSVNNNKGKRSEVAEEEKEDEDEDEEEAFESMVIDKEDVPHEKKFRKIPVLTVWFTRKKIPAFAKEFAEQSFMVQRVKEQD